MAHRDRCRGRRYPCRPSLRKGDTLTDQQYEGRLELTWTNKEKRLLADEGGSYTWVPPADYRVAEVRLLDDAGTVGEVGPKKKRASDNLLIRGDALNALTSLTELPEFASEYVGKVKLVYIDPRSILGRPFRGTTMRLNIRFG